VKKAQYPIVIALLVSLFIISSCMSPASVADGIANPSGGWPMLKGGPGHMGVSSHNVSITAPVVAWVRHPNNLLAGYGSGTLPVVADNGTVYMAEPNGNVSSIYPNGAVGWTVHLASSPEWSPALGPDGTIYITAHNYSAGQMSIVSEYALSSNGSVRWVLQLEGFFSGSVIAAENGTTYLSMETGHMVDAMNWTNDNISVVAVDPLGNIEWNLSLPPGHMSSPALAPDGSIRLQTNYSLFAIAPNGRIIWDLALEPPITNGGLGSIGEPFEIAVDGNGTTFLINGTSLLKINSTGDLQWLYPLHSMGHYINAPIVLFNGTVYVVTGQPSSTITAINYSGGLVWESWYDAGYGGYFSFPAVSANGLIIVYGHPSLWAISAFDGSEVWRTQALTQSSSWSSLDSALIGGEGRIYVILTGSGYRELVALDPAGIPLSPSQLAVLLVVAGILTVGIVATAAIVYGVRHRSK
jgi:outer membrane protein assembly factor BamB